MTTIKAKTNDPIIEHRVDILDLLDPNMVIGKGAGKKQRKLRGYGILI